MVIRCKGGESGLGNESMSLMNPVKKTPVARIWTILQQVSRKSSKDRMNNLPSTKRSIAAPEQNRERSHKECMSAEVCSNGEIGVECWRAHLILHPS
jgi:hypothetical protein